MSKLILLVAALATTFAVVGCGKTDHEKAKDHADTAVQRQNDLVQTLNASVPNSSWSDDDLNSYEKTLNEFEAVEAELKRIDGHEGIMITGGDNTTFIWQRRQALSEARRVKAERTSGISSEAMSDADIFQALQRVQKEREANTAELDAADDNQGLNPTVENGQFMIDLINKDIGFADQQIQLLNRSEFIKTEKGQDLLRQLNESKLNAETVLTKEQHLIDSLKTPAAPDSST